MNSEFLFWQEELLFSKKKREDKKRNKKLKSKLNDEDIPDLADIMGETCWPVSSDGVVFTLKKKTRFEFEVLMNTTAFFKVRTPWRRVKVFYSFRIFASLYSKVHNKEPKLSLSWWHKTTGDNATFPESDDGLSLVTRPSTPSFPPPPWAFFVISSGKSRSLILPFTEKRRLSNPAFWKGI